jgi:hypothetical protein
MSAMRRSRWVTTFGTRRDITLDELAAELFYPADDTTERLLRASGSRDER